MADILYKIESFRIIGACMEVHKKLGSGFLESVYSEALELEMKKAAIPFPYGWQPGYCVFPFLLC